MNEPVFYQDDRLTILCDDTLKTTAIAPASVDLVVTSPPYNVDIHYNSHKDDISYGEYLTFSRQWLGRVFEWLKDDGRLCLNIPLDKNKVANKALALI